MKALRHLWLGIYLLSYACSPNPEESPNSSAPKSQQSFLAQETAVEKPESPWPKFRRDLRQTGRSPLRPQDLGGHLWSYQTGKGIFSSPVIAADGSVLVGSADQYFYSLSRTGQLQWRFKTGEIIDSSALIDADERIYFGSGDGRLRALDKEGKLIWDFLADDPATTGAYIRWFEGNVAMGLDGTLLVPNDNFSLYAINPLNGQQKWRFPLNDQSWSSPAVDPLSGNLYFGSNYIAPFSAVGRFYRNLFALSPAGKILWRTSIPASITASPLLSQSELVVVGGFDGYVRAFDKKSGKQIWQFATLDHIYASPAELSDGTIIQVSSDGRVYALEGKTGTLKWSYTAGDPLRSSPAVDGDDAIYLGGGDGALYVLSKEGQLLYRMQLIEGDRNDLNASPALGTDAVYLAGENGEIWSVPHRYCLSAQGLTDKRCSFASRAPVELGLGFVSAFGSYLSGPPSSISPGEVIALRLVQEAPVDGDWKLLSEEGVEVITDPPSAFEIQLASDRRTLLLIPRDFWNGTLDSFQLQVKAPYLKGLKRRGLKWEGGTPAGALTGTWDIHLKASKADELKDRYALTRLAVPLPTIMPSYNQIGFDSLSYVLRILERKGDRALAAMLPALQKESGDLLVDSASGLGFPLALSKKDHAWVLTNTSGFQASAINFAIPFEEFRLSIGHSAVAQAYASARCSEIPTYGYFLRNLGFCSPKSDRISVLGATSFGSLVPALETSPSELTLESQKLSWGRIRLHFHWSTAIDPKEMLTLILYNTETLTPYTYDPHNLSKSFDSRGQLTDLYLETLAPKGTTVGIKLLLGEQPVYEGTL